MKINFGIFWFAMFLAGFLYSALGKIGSTSDPRVYSRSDVLVSLALFLLIFGLGYLACYQNKNHEDRT